MLWLYYVQPLIYSDLTVPYNAETFQLYLFVFYLVENHNDCTGYHISTVMLLMPIILKGGHDLSLLLPLHYLACIYPTPVSLSI